VIARREGVCPICQGKIAVGDRIRRASVEALGVQQWARVHEHCAPKRPPPGPRRDLDYDP
jgi:hypothetical protein